LKYLCLQRTDEKQKGDCIYFQYDWLFYCMQTLVHYKPQERPRAPSATQNVSRKFSGGAKYGRYGEQKLQ